MCWWPHADGNSLAVGSAPSLDTVRTLTPLRDAQTRCFNCCFGSSFSLAFRSMMSTVNRLRGYHAGQDGYPGHEQGIIPSWYYVPDTNYDHMQTFYPVKQSFYAREFPTAWRNIDFGLQDFHQQQVQQPPPKAASPAQS